MIVTSLLWLPRVVCMTTRLCTNPLCFEKPIRGPAGPRELSEKNQAICDELRRIAETPSPPDRSAHVDLLE